MQPDSSLTFVSFRNKCIWSGKRCDLARREEVFHNIALQARIAPLPRSKFTQVVKVYANCIGGAGTIVGVFVLVLSGWWFVSAVRNLLWNVDACTMMVMALVAGVLLLPSFSKSRRSRELLVYPPCVQKLYQDLITTGQVVACEVDNIERLEDSAYLIHYRFEETQTGETITGQYVTNKPFQTGMKMAALCLDTTCHVLL